MADNRTLVAQLPCMKTADLTRFEKEGGIWGQQRVIRRQQLTLTGVTAAVSALYGYHCVRTNRGNTCLVAVCTFPLFIMFGSGLGHAIGTTLYPSIADNSEVTMMRRTWWAKECAKNWDMSQVSEGQWKAKYPKLDVAKVAGGNQ